MKIYSLSDWQSDLTTMVDTIYQSLPSLPKAFSSDDINLESIEKNISLTQKALSNLRLSIEKHEFKDEKEEIFFFKHVKPLFSSSLIYWKNVLTLHLRKPVGGDTNLRKYYRKRFKTLQTFYELHRVMYEYLRGNYDYMDRLYFLRSSSQFQETTDSTDLNPKFTTAKDRLVGEIYANDLLEQYIHQMLQHPSSAPDISKNQDHNLKWTGSRAGMVELIYALQSGGVYNNGNIGIKELANIFQDLFQIDLGNYYNVFNEIRLRKKNRTSLLDLLREKILQKMDSLDEKLNS
jgi:RteC protein